VLAGFAPARPPGGGVVTAHRLARPVSADEGANLGCFEALIQWGRGGRFSLRARPRTAANPVPSSRLVSAPRSG